MKATIAVTTRVYEDIDLPTILYAYMVGVKIRRATLLEIYDHTIKRLVMTSAGGVQKSASVANIKDGLTDETVKLARDAAAALLEKFSEETEIIVEFDADFQASEEEEDDGGGEPPPDDGGKKYDLVRILAIIQAKKSSALAGDHSNPKAAASHKKEATIWNVATCLAKWEFNQASRHAPMSDRDAYVKEAEARLVALREWVSTHQSEAIQLCDPLIQIYKKNASP